MTFMYFMGFWMSTVAFSPLFMAEQSGAPRERVPFLFVDVNKTCKICNILGITQCYDALSLRTGNFYQ